VIERILVAVDASEGADAALHLAADVARLYGATVIVAHVVNPPAIFTLGPQTPTEAVDQMMTQLQEQAFSRAGKILGDAGVEHVEVSLAGPPARRLVEEAVAREVDLIVIGHRGLSGVERFFMGSVSSQVAHRAPCAVLIAPPPEEPPSDG